jgi:hypothetical protein
VQDRDRLIIWALLWLAGRRFPDRTLLIPAPAKPLTAQTVGGAQKVFLQGEWGGL